MTSGIPVRCSNHWAMKPYGSKAKCEFNLYPSQDEDETTYTHCAHDCMWTTDVEYTKDELTFAVMKQLKQLQINPEKNSGLQQDSNPWPPGYRSGKASNHWAMKPYGSKAKCELKPWFFFRVCLQLLISCFITAEINSSLVYSTSAVHIHAHSVYKLSHPHPVTGINWTHTWPCSHKAS